jgi:hypothetical protein
MGGTSSTEWTLRSLWSFKIFSKPEENKPLEKIAYRLDDNIKMKQEPMAGC